MTLYHVFLNVILCISLLICPTTCAGTEDKALEDSISHIMKNHAKSSRLIHSSNGCIMRGICGGVNSTLKQNCASNSYAVPSDVAMSHELVDYCPHLFNNDPFAPLCCDQDQAKILKNMMGLAGDLLGRCSSCYANFVNMWCNFGCHPTQKSFAVVERKIADKSSTVLNGVLEEYATDVRFFINKDYAHAIFDSCRHVKFSSGYALDAMCGESHNTCNADKFFRFLGTADGQNIPFNIHFTLTNDAQVKYNGLTYKPLKAQTYSCNQGSDRSPLPCSCSDCEKSCKNEKPYPRVEERSWSYDDAVTCNRVGADCRMASMECMSGLSIMAGGILALVLMGSIVSYYCMSKSTENDLRVLAITTGAISVAPGLISPTEFSNVVKAEERDKSRFKIDEKLIEWCQCYGRYAVDHTKKLFCISVFVALCCTSGLFKIRTTTDPVELWSNKNSKLRTEKDFFDQTFSPFHRVAQIIVYPKDQHFTRLPNLTLSGVVDGYFGPVFRKSFLMETFAVQNEILEMEVMTPTGRKITLNDICYKPLKPDNNNCAVMSIFNYFQNDQSNLNITLEDDSMFMDLDYSAHLQQCITGPFTMQSVINKSCLGDFGGPIMPYVVLGDFNSTDNYLSARGLVVTILIQNHIDKEQNEDAIAWEQEFVSRLKRKKSDVYSMSYMTESSIEFEIDRASSSDKITVIISYLFMFGYVAFALGQYKVTDNKLGSLFVNSKFMLGIAGVVVVALSVTSSIGMFAFYGIPATMIILEVQPFLILAVGVDNIFLLVQSYQRKVNNPRECGKPLKERVASICGEVIPSMMLSSLSESACFFLGAITDMPAVKTFSLYAGLAILFNFMFQATCFLALFIIDIRRQEAGRSEIFPWIKYPNAENTSEESFMFRFFENVYTPFLMRGSVRFLVCTVFSLWFAMSCLVMPNIRLGLDEKMAVPEDSYMLSHFKNMERFMSVGPPVFFVVEGQFDYSNRRLQNFICTGAGCADNSLGSQISNAAKYPQNSYISHNAHNWVDDYIDWLRPGGPVPCCRFFKDNGTFCSASQAAEACNSCNVTYKESRPDPKMFYNYLNYFLDDNPSKKCTKGGKAAYGNALDFHNSRGITASSFMAYHAPLRNQEDFIRAMESARYLAKNISCTLNAELAEMRKYDRNSYPPVNVYAYSTYYVFYEQYDTIVWAAILQLMLSLAVIFFVTFFLLGMDPWSAMIIVVTIASILVNLIGLMYWWDIDFNAISVVNLVMSVGISVEFCSHIVRAYSLSSERTRVKRTEEALANIGCSVLSGITFTKFGGVIVLAFAHTQIFQVFYFRMFFGIVIIGGLHGLVFLPVLLSIVGPPLSKRRMRDMLEREGYYSTNTRLADRKFCNAGTLSTSEDTGKDLSTKQKLVG